MIPIKKMKAQVVEQFRTVEKDLLHKLKTKNFESRVAMISIPMALAEGGMVSLHYNVKRKCFVKIKFNSFGKDHVIKLDGGM